jgi:hypothetical protein
MPVHSQSAARDASYVVDVSVSAAADHQGRWRLSWPLEGLANRRDPPAHRGEPRTITQAPRVHAPWLLAVAHNVSKTLAPQTPLGQLAGSHPVRGGEAIEAVAVEISQDVPQRSMTGRPASAS